MRKSPKIKYLIGDARKVLRGLPEKSVQCVVTSPPYYTLRDYEIPPSIWGGDPECEHVWGAFITDPVHPANRRCEKCQKFGVVKRTIDDNVEIYCVDCDHTTHRKSDTKGIIYEDGKKRWQHTVPNGGRPEVSEVKQGQYCQHCGAWRGCLGLEPTPKMFTEHIVEVFREVWRVLREDGVVLLNLGDSFAANRSYQVSDTKHVDVGNYMPSRVPEGLKAKDLMGVPWRTVFALQDAGWHFRQNIVEEQIWTCPDCGREMEITRLNCDREIIFSKINPMPESVISRPTSSHEHIFMLTKSGYPIYWVNAHRQIGSRTKPKPDYLYIDLENDIEYEDPPDDYDPEDKERWKRENQWRGRIYFYDNEAVREPHTSKDQRPRASGKIPGLGRSDRGTGREFFGNPAGRNLRSVWHVPIKGFSDAHFAVFDRRIPNISIRACTSPRACPKCGAPWERIVEKTRTRSSDEYEGKWADTERQSSGRRILQSMKARRSSGEDHDTPFRPPATIGWMPTCSCPDNTGDDRCVVLDPFAGSGTTLLEAYNNGRDSVGIDLKKEYAEMAARRIKKEGDFQEGLIEFQ